MTGKQLPEAERAWLEDECKRRGQTAVARLLGTSQSTISRLIAGSASQQLRHRFGARIREQMNTQTPPPWLAVAADRAADRARAEAEDFERRWETYVSSKQNAAVFSFRDDPDPEMAALFHDSVRECPMFGRIQAKRCKAVRAKPEHADAQLCGKCAFGDGPVPEPIRTAPPAPRPPPSDKRAWEDVLLGMADELGIDETSKQLGLSVEAVELVVRQHRAVARLHPFVQLDIDDNPAALHAEVEAHGLARVAKRLRVASVDVEAAVVECRVRNRILGEAIPVVDRRAHPREARMMRAWRIIATRS